jgi:hypothetical protein
VTSNPNKKVNPLTEVEKKVSDSKLEEKIELENVLSKDQQISDKLQATKISYRPTDQKLCSIQPKDETECKNIGTGSNVSANTSNKHSDKVDPLLTENEKPKETQNETCIIGTLPNRQHEKELTEKVVKDNDAESNEAKESRKAAALDKNGITTNLNVQAEDSIANLNKLVNTWIEPSDSVVQNFPTSIHEAVTESAQQLTLQQQETNEQNKHNTSPFLKSLLSQKQPLKYSQISHPLGASSVANNKYQAPMPHEPLVAANQASSALFEEQSSNSFLGQNITMTT